MSMNDLNTLPDYYIPEDRKERKDGRHCSFTIYRKERDIVNLETIGQIPNSDSTVVAT